MIRTIWSFFFHTDNHIAWRVLCQGPQEASELYVSDIVCCYNCIARHRNNAGRQIHVNTIVSLFQNCYMSAFCLRDPISLSYKVSLKSCTRKEMILQYVNVFDLKVQKNNSMNIWPENNNMVITVNSWHQCNFHHIYFSPILSFPLWRKNTKQPDTSVIPTNSSAPSHFDIPHLTVYQWNTWLLHYFFSSPSWSYYFKQWYLAQIITATLWWIDKLIFCWAALLTTTGEQFLLNISLILSPLFPSFCLPLLLWRCLVVGSFFVIWTLVPHHYIQAFLTCQSINETVPHKIQWWLQLPEWFFSSLIPCLPFLPMTLSTKY